MKLTLATALFFTLGIGMTHLANADSLPIDSFTTPSNILVTNTFFQTGQSTANHSPADAIGGQRRIELGMVEPRLNNQFARVESSPGGLLYTSTTATRATANFYYGLSTPLGLDLTSDFAADDNFIFRFNSPTQSPIDYIVQIISSNNSKAHASGTMPASTVAFALPLSKFVKDATFNASAVAIINPRFTPQLNGTTYTLRSFSISPDPAIEATRLENMLSISFSGILQESDDLVSWSDLEPQPESPVSIPIGDGFQFFKARTP